MAFEILMYRCREYGEVYSRGRKERKRIENELRDRVSLFHCLSYRERPVFACPLAKERERFSSFSLRREYIPFSNFFEYCIYTGIGIV